MSWHRDRVRAVLDLDLCIHDFEDSFAGRHSSLSHVVAHRQFANRLVEPRDVGHENEELADSERVSAEDEAAAKIDDERRCEGLDEHHGREKHRGELRCADVCIQVCDIQAVELVNAFLLVGEGLNDADAIDRLGQIAR